MSADLEEIAQEAYDHARELRAKEARFTGRKRGQVRKLRHAREEQSRLAQDLLDLKERIRHLEQKQDIRHGTRASGNGRRP